MGLVGFLSTSILGKYSLDNKFNQISLSSNNNNQDGNKKDPLYRSKMKQKLEEDG
jgi:hypothetical protein